MGRIGGGEREIRVGGDKERRGGGRRCGYEDEGSRFSECGQPQYLRIYSRSRYRLR